MPAHTSRPGLYGLVALCLAMGLGRFFYTSMLPPMLAEQRLTLADGSALAFWNYAGYLAGSMVMARYPLARRLSLRRGLMVGAGLTVLTMAAMIPDCPPALWSALRFVAGFASVLMFVCISTLVLPRADAATRGVLFAGVGVGIVLSGLLSGLGDGLGLSSATTWALGTLLGLLSLLWIARPLAAPRSTQAAPATRSAVSQSALTWLYGLAGFGYIIAATYLPTLAAETLGSTRAGGWIWLVAGLAAMPSPILWAKANHRYGTAPMLTLNLLLQAIGAAMPALWPTQAGLYLTAVLIGGTFMGTVTLVMPLARSLPLRPNHHPLAWIVAAYGLGQLAGPLLAGWLRHSSGSFALPCLIAGAALLLALPLVPAACGSRRSVCPPPP